MIRRIRRNLLLASPLAVWGAIAALVLPALPVQADDIEPEPYVEEAVEQPKPEPEPVIEAEVEEEEEEEVAEYEDESAGNIEKFLDLVLVRPLYVARIVVGLPFFAFYPFTIGSGYDEDVVALLWSEPFEATFDRPLGEAPGDY
ncbi:MAG: hypothetical protein JRF15_15020 [Deltaproteobacteria bacterium]|jgi:hypothetical protein|nr:hypothetical protein [Deltaproteobacteria bacterium]